jgi:SAM-dependent methyltransferase
MCGRDFRLDSSRQWDSEAQRRFWNEWDIQNLQDTPLGSEALRRGAAILSLLESLRLQWPRILEIGCANGWLAKHLQAIGQVTGVDLSDAAIESARSTVSGAEFHVGDILGLSFPRGCFDVVVTLETLSHVADQRRFMEIVANLLSERGYLILSTQNRTVYLRNRRVMPPAEGQLRRWVTRSELRTLLSAHFRCLRLFTIEPSGDMGFLRIMNSPKLNSALLRVFSQERIRKMKEFVGCGQTIITLAQKHPYLDEDRAGTMHQN